MSERRYTVAEIDRMRAIVVMLNAPHAWIPGGCGYDWSDEQQRTLDRRNEDELRTYLIAGVDPAELEAKLKAREEQYHRDAAEHAAAS